MQCHVTLVLYVVEYLTKVLNKKKKTKKNVPRCAFVVAILLLASFVLNSSMLLFNTQWTRNSN